MSPRARRRLAIASAALAGVLAAGVAIYQLGLLRGSSTERGELAPEREGDLADDQRRARGSYWPYFRYDEHRTGNNRGATVRPPFAVKWARPARERSYIEVPPAVADGVLVLVSYDKRGSHVLAVRADSGHSLWFRRYRRPEMFASAPAIADGRVYVTSKDGFLRVFDLRSGRLLWRRLARGDPTESPPIVSRGLVYFGRANGYVYAIDVRTRRLRWRYGPTGGNIASGVTLSGTTAYFASYGGGVHAVDRFTGKLRWRTAVQGRRANRVAFYSTPALTGRTLLIGAIDRAVYALDSRTGRVRWRFDTPHWVYASAAIRAGRLFIGDFAGNFYALSIRTGRRLWIHRMGPILGSATVIGDVVYISSLRPPRTVGLDTRTGRVVWRFRDGQFSPIVADGRDIWLAGRNRFYQLRPVPRRPTRAVPPPPPAPRRAPPLRAGGPVFPR